MASAGDYLQAPAANTVKVGVVGVTGAVGREMMIVMSRRAWQPSEIKVSEC
jgi:aspartate-semialdehyde dehydrogenase